MTMIGTPIYDRAGKFVSLASGALVIIVTLAGGVSWARRYPQNELMGKVNSIQADVAKIKDRVDAWGAVMPDPAPQ
jgi:photosystem II stability/assembly factor-like uncharacterized protein